MFNSAEEELVSLYGGRHQMAIHWFARLPELPEEFIISEG